MQGVTGDGGSIPELGIPLEEEMAPPVFLPGRSCGQRSLVGLQRVRHTEQLSTSTNSLRNENSVPTHVIKHILTWFFRSLLLKMFIINKKHYQLIIVVSLYHIISSNTTAAKNFP